ncbi:hypothetical protein dqs_0268 [Azoarcus olearius]|uniref:hypothetical protein n=1 Tax=Azoarcus sp. (strain BH72) TaxID=418699 RepID=UPI00080626F6|nr:hypothetical protein [Azoarcus olearius]ANQ83345.1 hypothetical protein dqs_0268 [Azoarcus olearius]
MSTPRPPAPPPPRARLDQHIVRAGADPAADVLVLLAGAYDGPADFIAAGFADARAARGLALDLVLVESDLAAVCDGSLAHRLQHEVIAPARAAGATRVHTGGISIGALTALMHADACPDEAASLVLLAPYPGNRAISGEIAGAGGLAQWTPAADYPPNDERRGWRALQRIAAAGAPPVWLGYGSEDRFARGHALMGAMLPAGAHCRHPGGHDWPTWTALWDHALTWLAPRLHR